MYNTNAIWNSLAKTGKFHDVFIMVDTLWRQLQKEAIQEGVKLERRVLKHGVNAIYLRRTRENIG